MKLLLDTHTFIWWDSQPDKLSSKILTLLKSEDSILILSVVSVWEMQIKVQLGRLTLDLPLSSLINSQRQINSIQILPITLEHVLALDQIPLHHKDPFDRLLIAQAIVENLTVASNDKKFEKYIDRLIW
jgi:PIN domain nuclease of toxin-antitoxin system